MPKQNQKGPGDLYKYSAMSFKMGAVITAGFLGGHYLDAYLNLKMPVFTLVLGFIGLALSIYIIILDTRKK
ncbi:MAG TPA: AtpZ/AtpI family protein [Flavobacteriales bacterium]|nr:AtpZ/AtpI family protein [Flavobacteriales bacterium]